MTNIELREELRHYFKEVHGITLSDTTISFIIAMVKEQKNG